MTSPSIHEALHPEVCQCTPEIRNRLVQGLPFLKSASGASLQALQTSLKSQGMKEGQEISPLRYATGVFGVVAHGAVKVYRYVGDDQFVIFDVLTTGDWFLYGSGDTGGVQLYQYPDQLTTLTASGVLTMDRARFAPLLESDPQLMASFFGALSARLTRAHERLVRFLAFPAEHRLAYLLDWLHSLSPKKPGFPGLIPFSLNRKDLASMVGLTFETVSRLLSSFEDDGLVRTGRGWVEIVDFPGLRARSKLSPV